MKLSILTPAVPSRLGQLQTLCRRIEALIGTFHVEHLVLLDNKRRTVGEKRDALLRASHGDYVAFVDDDDDISDSYVADIMKAIEQRPSVVTFLQKSSINGLDGTIEFKLGNPNEQFKPGAVTKRNAWHVCAWRRTFAVLSSFPASNYGEDWAFASRLCAMPGLSEVHVPKVLHYYRHDAKTTEAPPPG